MQPKIKLAKIELNLFTLLEKANREFTAMWKRCQKPNKKQKSFQNCAQSYETIMELIEHNRERNNVSDLLKSYYLEAWLGKIQSDFNDLPQNPSNEDVILSNDKKITKIKESLTHLKSQTDNLQTKLITKKIPSALSKDYDELFEKINDFFIFFDKNISQYKATYYYNFSEKLIEESESLSTITNHNDHDHKKNLLSTSILCLGISRDFYKELDQQNDADLTTQRRNYIQLELDNFLKEYSHLKKPAAKRKSFNPSETSNSKKNKAPTILEIEKSISESSKKSTEITATKRDSLEQKNQTVLNKAVAKLNSHVPPKKRKDWIIPEKEPAKIAYVSPCSIKVPINYSLNSEEEIAQQREEQYKKMLTMASVDDPFRFYSRLFFDLSHQLQVFSKESSNHTLLTKLSWLTIAKQLIGLTSNKNAADNTNIEKIVTDIRLLSTANQKNLKTISSQKRAEAYPTYTAFDLQSKDLQNLLIEEITDYYYGLEAFNLKSAAMSFLDLIPNIIKKHSFANTLKEIENTIQSVYKPIENLFYAKLLRELVKFHICDENMPWQKNTFSPEKKTQLNKAYLRILTISERFAEGSSNESQALKNKIKQLKNHLLQQLSLEQDLTLSDNIYSTSAFFHAPKPIEPLSIELLNNTLREHFQCLVKCRAAAIHSESIYKHLLQFIQTHCKQEQVNISHPRISLS